MFRKRLPQSENLICRDHDMTVQSVRIEFEFNFGIESTREIAFDNDAAEPLSAPGFDFRAKLFAPIEFDGTAVDVFQPVPRNRHASGGHRQGTELCRVDRKLVQRET